MYPKVLNPFLELPSSSFLSLSTHYEILDLLKEADHVYLSTFNKLTAYDGSKSEAYYLMSINGEKPYTVIFLKPRLSNQLQIIYWECSPSGRSQRISPRSLKHLVLFMTD